MKKLKSHFWYTKNQRNGILLLLGIIIILQFLYHNINFRDTGLVSFNQAEISVFQHQIDSLKLASIEDRKFKIYPFNPNFISDYKGYQLGMKTKEIDRLLAYRKKRLFVNSAKEFQTITKVSDSLLQKISPYFKFPEWVQKKNKEKKERLTFTTKTKMNISDISSTDINEATQYDFSLINGVDEYLSERIIKYRSKLQGFSIPEQLFEVWDLEKEVGTKILQTFSIQKKPTIIKTNINTASFKEILSNPYIDYELCIKIFDYKDEVAELQSISEIKNIEGFPLKNYNRIVLYLHAK
jgi:DNA uptake protein ComE-like DNA-binding protein|tara:strand:+ start:82 stop:969 length:888 start_codon:yes stop_codon:yes gene_type:complete